MVLIDITYTDLANNNGLRRRLLGAAPGEPQRPRMSAATSKQSWMRARDSDLNLGISLTTKELNMEHESQESNETENSEDTDMVTYVLAVVSVLIIGVSIYGLKLVKSMKKDQIRAQLNTESFHGSVQIDVTKQIIYKS